MLIEPAAFSVAHGQSAVERLIERLAGWYDAAPSLSPERLYPTFLEALGFDPPSLDLTERDFAAAVTTAREPRPSEAEVPVNRLAKAPFPTLIALGVWDLAPARARKIAAAGAARDLRRAGRAPQGGERRLPRRDAQPTAPRHAFH